MELFRHHLAYRQNEPGKIRYWDGSDTEEAWYENLADPIGKEMLEEHGWLDPSIKITYVFNRHGFREEEFDDRPCAIALGCSFTDGIGVAKEQTWPSYLSEFCGIKVWNLGLGGSSSDTCFRVMEYWMPKLRPMFVVMLEPPKTRFEVEMITGQFDSLLSWQWQSNASASPRDVFLRHWFTQETNSERHHKKNIMAMRLMSQELQVPFFSYPENFAQGCWLRRFPGQFPLARDLAHCGPMCYQLFADQICQDLVSHQIL